MTAEVLRTKLQRPFSVENHLYRTRLLRRLNQGLDRSVTLVAAPAGYGKSSIVGAWLDSLDREALDGQHACLTSWLSLDEGENQLPQFISYLAAAIEVCYPRCCQELRELLWEHPTPSIETLAAVLVDQLSRQQAPIVLVLDDLHQIRDHAVIAFLTQVIEYAPPQTHLVLITRVDPPLPLSRWRAAGRLHEVRLDNLSFTLEETADFFRANLDQIPPPSLIEALHQRTEGWIVGIGLAALTLRGRTDYAELESHFEAQVNRFTADYLVDEVLSQQHADVQRFLVCTAILNRFSADLCAAVLELDPEQILALIDHLLQSNLFLVELSTPAYWYRYHHQFQDMLLSKLYMRFDRQEVADLHRRAAAWLVEHGFIGEALTHLTTIADHEAIADLVEAQRVRMLNELAIWELESWLNQVPDSLLNQRANLVAGMAWVKRDRIDHEACLALTQRAINLLAGDLADSVNMNRPLLAAELNALRLESDWSLTHEESLALVRESWALLEHRVAQTHCLVPLSLAYASHHLGDLDFAVQIVRSALDATPDWPLVARCRIAHANGFFHLCSGNITEAEKQFRRNLLVAQQHNLLVIAAISQHGLGAIADMRNQLDEAEQFHLAVVEHPYLTSGRDAVVDMYGLLGVYVRRGEPEKGRLLVQNLKEDAKRAGMSFFLEQVTALEAYADLSCGDLKPSVNWALSMSRSAMATTADRIPDHSCPNPAGRRLTRLPAVSRSDIGAIVRILRGQLRLVSTRRSAHIAVIGLQWDGQT